MHKVLIINFLILTGASGIRAQMFAADDSIRGSITAERAWWDLTFYHLKVSVDPASRTIKGSNEIRYKVLQAGQQMQVDLQPPLVMDRVEQDGKPLAFTKKGRNAYIVSLQKPQTIGHAESITVWYNGKPLEAANAPWDGGFSWSKDAKGNPFVATSCQELGSSVWWPCKDHMYDEPDSQAIDITVPGNLMDVSNGRLRGVVDNPDGTRTFRWYVSNPINNYGVNVNIGNYVHFSDTLNGEKGLLDLAFYVLPENLEKAKVQFKQAKEMLRAFEHWFGPYPFYEDGYKLVEVPYLGMEHQSSVTYGNGFKNGYRGMDYSGSGWGKKWDYIIIHESGHEWFANNITYNDIADMWVHESFTTYSECLFTEYYYGKEAGAEYMRGCRKMIQNRKPIVGNYGVNNPGSGDMYPKGANMLHTIRQVVDNDVLWREILRGLNRDFYHQTVDGAQIEAYLSQKSGKNLQKVFDQYLRHTNLPVLEYKIRKGKLAFRWMDCVDGFDMPVKVALEPGVFTFIHPTTDWQSVKYKGSAKGGLDVDRNFYIETKKD